MKGKITQKSIEAKSALFNKIRIECQNREFTRKELITFLKDKKISENLTLYLIKHGEINCRKSARGTIYYSFRNTPLYKGKIEAYYNSLRGPQPLTEEQKAVESIKNMGYRVQKLIGFNEEKFSKDHPDLYKKYLEYETLLKIIMLQLIFTLESSNFKAISDIKKGIFNYFGSRCILNDGGEFNTMTLTLDALADDDRDRLNAICNNANSGVLVVYTSSNIPLNYSELYYESVKAKEC